jgi:hypothetical protein
LDDHQGTEDKRGLDISTECVKGRQELSAGGPEDGAATTAEENIKGEEEQTRVEKDPFLLAIRDMACVSIEREVLTGQETKQEKVNALSDVGSCDGDVLQ